MIAHIVIFAIGMIFALGFGLAGVVDPATIVNFLHVSGPEWDPSVAIVITAAIAVTAVSYRLMFRRRTRPVLASRFGVPTRRDIDRRLVAGAAIFGFGWGFVGLCPGPAFASFAGNPLPVGLFIASMVGGMLLYGLWDGAQARARARRESAASQRDDAATPVVQGSGSKGGSATALSRSSDRSPSTTAGGGREWSSASSW